MDKSATLDAVVVTLAHVPQLPSGTELYGWLVGGQDMPEVPPGAPAVMLAGRIPVGPDGSAQVTLTPDSGAPNLVGRFDGFVITIEKAGGTPSAPSEQIAFAGQVLGDAVVHLRHLLATTADTPGKVGAIEGLKQQVELMAEHIGFQGLALQNNNLYETRWHAEHVVNIIEGTQGKHYGDVFKDGQIQNPGDGFGLLMNGNQMGHLETAVHHASMAASLPDATPDMVVDGAAVTRTVTAMEPLVEQLDEKELALVNTKSTAEAQPLMNQIKGLTDKIVNGYDINGDGRINPLEGEGGMQVAYQEAVKMATFDLERGTAFGAAQATQRSVQELTASTPGAPGGGSMSGTPAGPAPAGTAAGAGMGGMQMGSGPAPATAAAPPTAPAMGSMPMGTGTAAPAAQATTTAAPAGPGGTGATGPASGLVTIEIRNTSFGPPLTVKQGTTVVWVNRDQLPHTVTADNGEFRSDVLQPGATFGFTFSQAGTYPYFCELHGNRGGLGMASTITVVP